jgi:hypothetical protein
MMEKVLHSGRIFCKIIERQRAKSARSALSEKTAAAENGTVTIDLRETGWTTLKREVFEAAAKRGDVTIIILYTHWGQECTLTIPSGTDFSALFEAQFLEVSQLPALLHLSAV